MTQYPTKYFETPQHAMTAGFVASMIIKGVEEQDLDATVTMVVDGEDHTPFIDITMPSLAQLVGLPPMVRIHILPSPMPYDPLYPPADWVAPKSS